MTSSVHAPSAAISQMMPFGAGRGSGRERGRPLRHDRRQRRNIQCVQGIRERKVKLPKNAARFLPIAPPFAPHERVGADPPFGKPMADDLRRCRSELTACRRADIPHHLGRIGQRIGRFARLVGETRRLWSCVYRRRRRMVLGGIRKNARGARCRCSSRRLGVLHLAFHVQGLHGGSKFLVGRCRECRGRPCPC